jgi:ketosteroid isomerase-like protein
MRSFKSIAVSLMLLAASLGPVHAASDATNWEAAVRKADHSYWDAYNRRDPVTMNSFLADDVEFYHDRGGTLIGKAELGKANSVMKTNKARLRRALVPGSLHLYPMRRGEQIYGAVVTGEHDFFAMESGKADQLLGRALFTHLMLLKDGQWKIARILSYSHMDAK